MFDIYTITRKNVKQMKAYSSARDEFKGQANICLDANENPFPTALNRYPDPQQSNLKAEISKQKNIQINQIFIGNGSDEAIDLLYRAFCEPGISKAIAFPPTYGMYEVLAAINNVELINIPLNKSFELPHLETIKSLLPDTGILFICSPNNPTGSSTSLKRIRELSENFKGLVVVDEAYIDFSEQETAISLLKYVPNLVVLQTFSKAYGLAGARVGMAFASSEIIAVLNKIKPPYNINSLSVDAAMKVLIDNKIKYQINTIKEERNQLTSQLVKLNIVSEVFPSDANFLFVRFVNSNLVFESLIKRGIVVRNRSSQVDNCLRITIGTKEENQTVMQALKELSANS